jgi:flavin reductase (DIM6/NTAB) family NADH-FMN oxidoreductase RutF
MRTIFPDDLSHRGRHQLLLSGVAPRPVAFVSSQDEDGVVNLAPFSFFNVYASKPPIIAIGPAISAKTGHVKDTWRNIMATGECTISAVSFRMVGAMNLAAAEYPPEVDEYVKSGFTKAPSLLVRPPWVKESPYAMECKLMENIELRRDIGGNGNLMLLEAIAFHVSDSVYTDDKIDPRKMDLVARMAYGWYTHARADVIFDLAQPHQPCIGMDALPDHIRSSDVLTGNELARLAAVTVLPMLDGSFPQFPESYAADSIEIELSAGNPSGALFALLRSERAHDRRMLHRIAQVYIAQGRIEEAWQTLLLEG